MKDTIVSFKHFLEATGDFKGSKDQFIEAFLNDSLFYTPFWPHVLEFWEMRNENQIFFTSYERMKKDMKGVLIGLCDFLNKTVPNEDILKQAVDHLSFENMKSMLNY